MPRSLTVSRLSTIGQIAWLGYASVACSGSGSEATGGSASTIPGATGGALGTGGAMASGGAVGNGGGVTGSNVPATGGTLAAGGTTSREGTPNTGGAPPSTSGNTGTAGAASSSACSGAPEEEFTRVSGWLKNTVNPGSLPTYAYNNIKTNFPTPAEFDRLACAIVKSCDEFAPSVENWVKYCQAVVTSAIVSESSYNPKGVVYDTYARRAITGGTADDPTVGLLQDRFSSTISGFNQYGPMAKMAAIGCAWPPELLTVAGNSTTWATAGGTTHLSFMQDPVCNIALGTWFYFHNATGNGGTTVVWLNGICAGNGVAGNMIVGLLSHLQGGSYARPADPNNSYVAGIKARVALLLGGLPNPDPFTQVLPPEPAKYCK